MGKRTARAEPAGFRPVQAVDRALAILERLAAAPEGLALSRVAGATGLKAQTAQSLLRTLEKRNLVVQGGRGQPYRLGPGILALGRRWLASDGPGTTARPAVEGLAQRTGEYVLLAELRNRAVYRLMEARPEQTLMVSAALAERDHLHVMATGKVLLAFADEATREALLAGVEFKRQGPRSITSRARFLEHLEEVRKRGYALSVQETNEHLAALAWPVRDASGAVHAALGIALPMVRLSPGRREALLQELKRTAGEIEKLWGYAPSRGG